MLCNVGVISFPEEIFSPLENPSNSDECSSEFFIENSFLWFLCSLLCLISANIFRNSNFDKASLAFRSFSPVKNNLCKDKHVIGFGLAKKVVSFYSSHGSNKSACFRVIMENSRNWVSCWIFIGNNCRFFVDMSRKKVSSVRELTVSNIANTEENVLFSWKIKREVEIIVINLADSEHE